MLRVQVNRGLDGKFQKLENMLKDYGQEYVFGMATEIADNSPVDTGTYMREHNVGTTAVSPTTPTTGTPRPPGEGPFGPKQQSLVQPTVDRLVAQATPLLDTTARLVFSLMALNMPTKLNTTMGMLLTVEAAREHKRIAAEAAQRAKARNR
jgi:hypothetical protein